MPKHEAKSPLQEELDPTLDVQTLFQDDERSVALVVLRGVSKASINFGSDTKYHVIAGEGLMQFPEAATTTHRLFPGIRIVAPSGMAYQSSGDLVMLATSTPPFDPQQVEHL